MIGPDVEARRMLVEERRAALAHDALRTDALRPNVTESRARPLWRRFFVPRFRLQLRAARSGS